MAPFFPILDSNCFLLYNKALPKNVISAWGTGEHDIKAGADPISLDQIWILKPDPHAVGKFYIENIIHTGARIAMLNETDVGLAVGEDITQYASSHMWSLNSKGNNYFEVVNEEFKSLLTLSDGGKTLNAKPSSGDDSQQWLFEPRYKCEIEEREIFRFDNTGNDKMAYEQFELTLGVVMLFPDYLMKSAHTPQAIENAMAVNMLKGDITYHTFTELKTEQWRTFSKENYNEWYDKLIVPLNAYPNRKYRIVQFVATCTGKLETDKLEVHGPWKAYNEF